MGEGQAASAEGGLVIVEFAEALPEDLGTAKASVCMVVLSDQLFVWVGDGKQPTLESMQYAIGSRAPSSPAPSVTTLVGNRFNSLGEKVSTRLCTKLGVPVVCSWNVKSTAFPQEELDMLSNLIAKSVMTKYREASSSSSAAA